MAYGGRRPGAGRKPGSITGLRAQARRAVGPAIRDAMEPLIRKGSSLIEQVLNAKLPCGVCHGKGKTQFQPRRKKLPDGSIIEADPEETVGKLKLRTCLSCYGSGLERLSPAERLRAALEIIEYGHPKLRAVEHTGKDGGPIQHTIAQVIRQKRFSRNAQPSELA